jgi:eukaryotic-like serine/threonine-protein kinase
MWTALAATALAAAAGAWFMAGAPRVENQPAPVAVPLTSYPGSERRPTFSPDASQVAFEWDQGDGPRIYVKLVGPGDPRRLTSGDDDEFDPAWSPDGQYIAFFRKAEQYAPGETIKGGFTTTVQEFRMGLFLVPALGGVERKLSEVDVGDVYFLFSRFIGWSRDSKHLIVSAKASRTTGQGLLLVPINGGEARWLLQPPDNRNRGDLFPTVSPDGRTLAFLRREAISTADTYTAPLSPSMQLTGEPRKRTFLQRFGGGVAWMPHGESLLIASGYWLDNQHLYRVDLKRGAAPVQLFSLGAGVSGPSVSVSGRVAYTRLNTDINIWRQEIPPAAAALPAPVKLIASTATDRNPQYSPDGTRIAFQSTRSGLLQIWTCAADGAQCVQVTHEFTGPQVGTPRWSPDGKTIVFDSSEGGSFDIYLIDAGGGRARRLTDHPADDAIPSFSHDGKWIYFMSPRSGREEIWRIPSEGGAAVQITREGGARAFESKDGSFLYYSQHRSGTTKLWKKSLDGSQTEDVEVADGVYSRSWALTADRLYYRKAGPEGTELRYRVLATGRDVLLGKVAPVSDIGFSASPDGRFVIYGQVDTNDSDLMMVEPFR